MRVVSYNVRYFGHGLKGLASTTESKRKIAAALASLSPLADVIALQEIETRSLRATIARRDAPRDETQLSAFLRHLDAALAPREHEARYRPLYFPAHEYRVGELCLYTTGLAVLVNTRTLDVVEDNSAAPVDVTEVRAPIPRAVKQTRIVAHARLEDAHGRRLHVFNTHLSLPTFWAREYWSQDAKMGFGANQLAEARRAVEYARATAAGEPFIVLGDFNSSPASLVYRYLTEQARLIGAQAALRQIDPTSRDGWATAGFMRMRMHLDHVFGADGVEFESLDDTLPFGDATSRFHGLSDHAPLVVTLGA